MITFATYGLGMLLGTWFAGITVDFYTMDGVKDWTEIWIVPAIIAAIVLALFIFIFKEKSNKKAASSIL